MEWDRGSGKVEVSEVSRQSCPDGGLETHKPCVKHERECRDQLIDDVRLGH